MSKQSRRVIMATSDLSNLKKQAEQERYADWHIKFHNLHIYCQDLLATYHSLYDIFIRRIYDFNADTDTPYIIDGGGHIGIFTLFMKCKYPKSKIVIFEPDAANLELLLRNIKINKIEGVKIIPAGLSDIDGVMQFQADLGEGSNLFASTGNCTVHVKNLTDYMLHPVDLLKLNIEGAEWKALRGVAAHLRNTKNITLEYHGFSDLPQTLHQILALFDSQGFRYTVHNFTSLDRQSLSLFNAETRFYLLVHAIRLAKNDFPQKYGLGDICRTSPVSKKFGLDLGTSICRVYIDQFLEKNSNHIQGRVLEIAEDTYTKRFGHNVAQSDILHVQPDPSATIVGNLSTGENIPREAFDCIILTQTLQCIYDIDSVLKNCHAALKPGGTLLLTASGISQISRYDMERWGEYWRFTHLSLKKSLENNFPNSEVEVQCFGNVASAKAYLDGLPAEELPLSVFNENDPDYQMLLGAIARKAKIANADIPAHHTSSKGQPPRILLYHRVAKDPVDAQLLCVSPKNFDAQMEILARHYRPVGLRQLLSEVRQGKFVPNSVAVTFDDGYQDNLINALPILTKHGIPATIFVSTANIGQPTGFWGDTVESALLTNRCLPDKIYIPELGGTWPLQTEEQRLTAHDDIRARLRRSTNSQIQAVLGRIIKETNLEDSEYLNRPVLNKNELKRLAESPLIELGAHAENHVSLGFQNVAQQRAEIQSSRNALQNIIKKPVLLFAYPYGDKTSYTPDTMRMVREEGFEAGIANYPADLNAAIDMFAIPRRLVRNWSQKDFEHWLVQSDKKHLENIMLRERKNKLLAVQKLPLEKGKLRIVYVNTTDNAGGAAKSTIRLLTGLARRGHKTNLLVGHKTGHNPFVSEINRGENIELKSILEQRGLLDYHLEGTFGLPFHYLVQQADVLHLQNLHGHYFNHFALSCISRFKPTVWTLRDMQSITGHCAHSLNCKKWETGCGECPDLSIYPGIQVDATRQMWHDKKAVYAESRLHIVCPSIWLKNKVEKSILQNHPMEVIANATDTNIFRPYDKVMAREHFGLPANALIAGCVAHKGVFDNFWKGGSYMAAAISQLKKDFPDIYFVSIGQEQSSDDPRIIFVPHIHKEEDMAMYYSAMDLFLYTSVADTCPLVVIEALSCGLPVVSFGTGGIPELVRDGQDGFVVPPGNAPMIAKTASIIIKNKEIRDKFARDARVGAEKRFRLEDMSAKYENLYLQAIEEFRRNPPKSGQGAAIRRWRSNVRLDI